MFMLVRIRARDRGSLKLGLVRVLLSSTHDHVGKG